MNLYTSITLFSTSVILIPKILSVFLLLNTEIALLLKYFSKIQHSAWKCQVKTNHFI